LNSRTITQRENEIKGLKNIYPSKQLWRKKPKKKTFFHWIFNSKFLVFFLIIFISRKHAVIDNKNRSRVTRYVSGKPLSQLYVCTSSNWPNFNLVPSERLLQQLVRVMNVRLFRYYTPRCPGFLHPFMREILIDQITSDT